MKRLISTFVTIALFLEMLAPFVATADEQGLSSPESKLLEFVIAESGKKLSRPAAAAEIQSRVQQYATEVASLGSTPEQALARFIDAARSLGVSTPEFESKLTTVSSDLAQQVHEQEVQGTASSIEAQSKLVSQLERSLPAMQMPQGHAFHSQSAGRVLLIVGGSVFIVTCIYGLATNSFISSDGTSHNAFLFPIAGAGLATLIVGAILESR